MNLSEIFEKKKLYIYGAIGLVGGAFFYLYRQTQNATAAANNAAQNAASQAALYSQIGAAGQGLSSGAAPVNSGSNAIPSATSAGSDIASILTALAPLFTTNTQAPQNSTQNNDIQNALSGLQYQINNLVGNVGKNPNAPPDQTSATALVTSAYENFLGRAPDQPGLNAWVQFLTSGSKTPAQVISGIAGSPEATIGDLLKQFGVADTFSNIQPYEQELLGGTTITQITQQIENGNTPHPAGQSGGGPIIPSTPIAGTGSNVATPQGIPSVAAGQTPSSNGIGIGLNSPITAPANNNTSITPSKSKIAAGS